MLENLGLGSLKSFCGQRDARLKVKRPCQCCFSTVEVKSAQEAD